MYNKYADKISEEMKEEKRIEENQKQDLLIAKRTSSPKGKGIIPNIISDSNSWREISLADSKSIIQKLG